MDGGNAGGFDPGFIGDNDPKQSKEDSPEDKIRDGKKLILIAIVTGLLSLCLKNPTLMVCALLFSPIFALAGVLSIREGHKQRKREQETASTEKPPDAGGAQ